MTGAAKLLLMGVVGCGLAAARSSSNPQVSRPQTELISCARHLAEHEQWQRVLEILPQTNADSAEIEYYRGMALARLGRLKEAEQAFESGRKKDPFDKRFHLELAGVDFKLGLHSQSKQHLKCALKADPSDSYANDFMGTLYFVEGNLKAALKFWNRIGKPFIENVSPAPTPGIDPVSLDRAFAFSPASLLTLKQLRITETNLDFIALFSSYRFELVPRQDDKFDLRFRSVSRAGLGRPSVGRLLSTFRETPYQTVHLDLWNLKGSSSNLESALRWDAQKRRVFARFSGPLSRSPLSRFHIWLDGRNENWGILRPAPANSPLYFNARRLEAGAGIRSVVNDWWGWDSNLSLSYRRFNGPALHDQAMDKFLSRGPGIKYEISGSSQLLVPERRLTLRSFATGQVMKIWSDQPSRFVKLGGGTGLDWLPQTRGDDYRISGSLRAGRTFGLSPIDELYELSVAQDSDLYLRGHPGTSDGQKGAGPLGGSFVLLNFEMDKILFSNGLWKAAVGPFVDSGKTFGSKGYFGSAEWLWDAGIQSKIVILHGWTFALSYGRDLRSGKSAFFARLGPALGFPSRPPD